MRRYSGSVVVGIVQGLALALLVGFLPEAHAQQEAERIDEIMVTARKREESIQEIPVSVSAFTSEQIQQLGVTDLSELSDFSTGFTFETFGGRRGAEGDTSRPVIRGQSNITGEGNAAIFVDGILYSESILSFPFDIIERVEVIRGPQAAQFGRATFSGAINIITKSGTNEFENRIRTRFAQDEDYEINLGSRGPLIEDRLFYFIHGRWYDYGGEYTNELDGRTVGGESTWGINGGLEFLATDNLTLNLKLGYNEDDDDIPAQRVLDRFANNCFLDQARQYFCGEIREFESVTLEIDRLNGEDGLEREVFRATGSAEWDIGGSGFLLVANTGVVEADSVFGNDQTFLGDPIQFVGGQFVRVEDSDLSEWSTELRLESPASRRFRYSAGVYAYDRDRERLRRFPGTQNIITDFGEENIENKSVFGAIEYDFTDRLSGGIEFRYQEDEIINITASGEEISETYTSTQPRFTLNYQHTENLLYYASIAQGNKPGAINSDPRLPDDVRFADEEESWNYELGVKSDLLDRRLRLNAAVYYIDWTQQQLTQSGTFGGIPISLITNAGETEVKGFELDTSYLVSDRWSVGLSYALADATFKENCDPVQGAELTGFDCVSSVTGAPGGSVEGNQTPNSPKHQATLNSTYVVPLSGERDLFFRGDYSYQSKKFAQVHNLAFVGDRHLLNLKAGMETENWKLTLFVDNVLDDLTPSTIVRFADLGNLNIGPNQNPAQDNVPGSTAVERGFLVPLPRSRRFGVTFEYSF